MWPMEQTGPHAPWQSPHRPSPSATDPPPPAPPLLQTSPQLTLPGCSDNLGQSLLGQSPEGTRQVWEEQGRCLGPTPSSPGLAPRIPAQPRADRGPDHWLLEEVALGEPRGWGTMGHTTREVPTRPQRPLAAPGA